MISNATGRETDQISVFGGSARVPLGSGSSHRSDVAAALPFGLRFARPLPTPAEPAPASRLCPIRQIAVTVDGSDSPWYQVVSTSMTTTGESTDGTGSTGGFAQQDR